MVEDRRHDWHILKLVAEGEYEWESRIDFRRNRMADYSHIAVIGRFLLLQTTSLYYLTGDKSEMILDSLPTCARAQPVSKLKQAMAAPNVLVLKPSKLIGFPENWR